MLEKDLEDIYTTLQKGVQDIFKSNKSLESFSWISAAIWNDDWYDNTVSKIVVNKKYSFDGFGEIQDIKREFSGLYFNSISELESKHLNQFINQYLNQNFKKAIFLGNSFSKDYIKAKKEIKDTLIIAFNSREYFGAQNISISEKQYFYNVESFISLFESIEISDAKESTNLLQFVLTENVINSFFKIVDKNIGLQKLINLDFTKFIEITNTYCKKHFLKELMQDKTLKYFREIIDLLNQVFNIYYKVETPFKRFEEIQIHEIIPSLNANRKEIEIRKWK